MDTVVKVVRIGLTNSEMLQAYVIECEGLADEIFDSWARAPNGTVPLFQSFSYMINSYTVVFFFGRTFYREHGEEMIPLFDEFSKTLSSPLLRITPHRFWHMTGPGARGFRLQNKLCKLIEACAQEQYDRKKQGIPFDESTYISLLCKHFDEKYVSYMGYHCILLMFATHSNLARTLPWLYLHARRIPGSLERCRSEIENESVLSGKGIRPYLEACLRETGRLYTGLSILRVVPKLHPNGGITLLGHKIPSGCIVACSAVVTQRDPALFEDPETWRPERFLSNEGKTYAEWFQRREFIQFGSGEHACIGEKMVRLLLLNTIMETWLQKYDIEVVSGLKDDEGVDGVGIEAAFIQEPLSTPPALGRDVMVSTLR